MTFAEHLAAFRAEFPQIEVAEVYVTDLNGIPRGKLVPIDMLEKLADGGMKLPISTLGLDIFGADVPKNAIALEVGDPDGILRPLPETLAPMLWAKRPTAQMQCMMLNETGEAVCDYDPRGVLARVVEKAHAMGLTPVMALELEFYLIDPELPLPPKNPVAGGRLSRAQLYDMSVIRAFEPVLSEITEAAQALGAPAETAICEFGAGQFELNLRHVEDALEACDHMVALKRAIRGVARSQGMDATFMPKPFGEMAGSGQHIHLSLLDAAGHNIFDSGTRAPNEKVCQAVAGMLDSMADTMLLYAPHHNSYRRLLPGSYAPVVAAWGIDNRGVAVRVPETSGKGARIEHRVSGSDANAYLFAAAVLAGALDGLERGLVPPDPIFGEANEDHAELLPISWAMAEQALSASDFVEKWLGSEFQRIYGAIKRQERSTLMGRVSDVEYDAYLRTV
ncbi:MAG: glutamine synthetase family protein [Thermohalobaculum sp.]|nr:glutamine synthetase family protein [Thermohalobaculum sp.]